MTLDEEKTKEKKTIKESSLENWGLENNDGSEDGDAEDRAMETAADGKIEIKSAFIYQFITLTKMNYLWHF